MSIFGSLPVFPSESKKRTYRAYLYPDLDFGHGSLFTAIASKYFGHILRT